jgi:hypothetical protein
MTFWWKCIEPYNLIALYLQRKDLELHLGLNRFSGIGIDYLKSYLRAQCVHHSFRHCTFYRSTLYSLTVLPELGSISPRKFVHLDWKEP